MTEEERGWEVFGLGLVAVVVGTAVLRAADEMWAAPYAVAAIAAGGAASTAVALWLRRRRNRRSS